MFAQFQQLFYQTATHELPSCSPSVSTISKTLVYQTASHAVPSCNPCVCTSATLFCQTATHAHPLSPCVSQFQQHCAARLTPIRFPLSPSPCVCTPSATILPDCHPCTLLTQSVSTISSMLPHYYITFNFLKHHGPQETSENIC